MTATLPRRSITRTPKFPSLLTAARAALDRSESEEAAKLARHAINHPTMSAENKGIARCLLAEALESLAREREALEVLAVYEKEAAGAALSSATLCQVYLRLGSAHGYTGNPPLAVTYAKQALALADQTDSLSIISGKLLLGRLYRAMGETGLARLQYGEALEAVRFTGSQLLLAHAFGGRGAVSLVEGDLMGARKDFERALENLGAQPALLLRGNLEANRAVLANLQGRPREGVAMLERAISYFTRAGNMRLLSMANTNLGFILIQLGETERACDLLETSLATARGWLKPACWKPSAR